MDASDNAAMRWWLRSAKKAMAATGTASKVGSMRRRVRRRANFSVCRPSASCGTFS